MLGSRRTDMAQPLEKTELGLLPRMIASGWFAGAACLPIVFFFGVIGRSFFIKPSDATNLIVACTFIFLPVSMAAFFGFSFGTRIMNDQIVSRASRAVIHGMLIAALSYLGFMLAYTVIILLVTSRDPFEIFTGILRLFAVGAILVGWLILLIGAFSGWLLFKVSSRIRARLSTPMKRSRPVHPNFWAAAVLFAVLFACWLPFRKEAQREYSEQSRRDLVDAVWRNDPLRVKELLDSGLSVETQDVAGSALLLTAAEKGHTRIVKILLDHGANPNVTTDRYGRRTPLLWAAVNADLESVKALLDHGANINTPDAYGRTPLMEAAWATDRDTVKLLIERGADVNYIAPDGQTTLSIAKSRRDNTPTKLDREEETINRQGADAGENIIDSRDFQNTAIMKRSRERHDAIIDLLKSYGAK